MATNTYTVEYKEAASGIWLTWTPDPHAHAASPFTTSITGLTFATTYDVRLTYNDADGIIAGTPMQTLSVALPFNEQVACQTGCVGTEGVDYHGTIQAAIDAASTGDVVTVLPGSYPERLTLGWNAPDSVDITLRSRDGAGSVTVTGTGTSDTPVMDIAGGNGSTIQGLTLNNSADTGYAARGVYIRGNASPTFEQTIIENNLLNSHAGGQMAQVHLYRIGATRSSSAAGSGVTHGGDGGGIYCKDRWW